MERDEIRTEIEILVVEKSDIEKLKKKKFPYHFSLLN
jgi:hypothetical protein